MKEKIKKIFLNIIFSLALFYVVFWFSIYILGCKWAKMVCLGPIFNWNYPEIDLIIFAFSLWIILLFLFLKRKIERKN
jgi:hypothetical protein